MKAFQPYLNFDGQTREAMTFYHQCLGGDLFVQTFADAKIPGPPGSENRVIHAAITKGPAILMASDSQPGAPVKQGDSVHVNVVCESLEEIERLFKAMSAGANVTMPLADQFWGARFGMLTDKFGMNWMFNYELPKKA